MRTKQAIYSYGMTLIELMIIITIAALMMAASGFAFVTSNQNQLAGQLTTQLAASLRYARSQALSLGVSVSVCPASSSALTACSTSSTAWNNGWIVFQDYNGDGIINTTGGTDTILAVYPMSGSNPNMTATISGAFASYANFSTIGLTTTNKQLQITIKPTGCTGNYGQILYLTPSGRVNTVSTSCS
jgi:type IV fimbrial biogenesis protein FimT